MCVCGGGGIACVCGWVHMCVCVIGHIIYVLYGGMCASSVAANRLKVQRFSTSCI